MSVETEMRIDDLIKAAWDDAAEYGNFKKSLNSFLSGVTRGVEAGYNDGYDYEDHSPTKRCPRKRSVDFRRGFRFGYDKGYDAGLGDLQKSPNWRDPELSEFD